MPAPPPPPYALIAAARIVAKGFVEHAQTHQAAETLTEGARAIWQAISVLEDDPRRPPGERSENALRMALARQKTAAARSSPAD